MITEREKRALQLAKRAYGYFTHEALNIAKEIIALVDKKAIIAPQNPKVKHLLMTGECFQTTGMLIEQGSLS